MLFRYLLLIFCVTAICAQKGGRRASPSEANPSVQRSPSRAAAALKGRKLPQASEPIEQVQEPERDPDEDREVVSAVRPTRPPVRRPQPQPQPAEEDGHEPAPEPYSFSYSVDDPETGAASSREETQDANGEIIGFYHIKDADGRTRRVDYTAGKDGFKATIKSNEEGLNARAPADVNIELSPSASERSESYAPNNRPSGPIAAESAVKGVGRPPPLKFFQRLLPAPAPPAPQPLEQTRDDTQISQTYETDPEITQQQNVDDEEIPLEAAPTKGGPPPQAPVQISLDGPRERPVQRPIGAFQPQRIQTHAEQGLVSVQPLRSEPQVREGNDIPNSIQEVKQTFGSTAPAAHSPPAATPLASPKAYSPVRPLSPILGSADVQLSPPLPTHYSAPQLLQYFHRSPAIGAQIAVQPQTVPNLVPLSPPNNNLVFQQQREPVVQQQLLQFLQPIGQTPQQPIVFEQPQPRPIHLFSSLDNTGLAYYPGQAQQLQPQRHNGDYALTVQHREQQDISQEQTPRQDISEEISQEQDSEEPEQRLTPFRTDSQELQPPPTPQQPPQALPQLSQPVAPIQYRPLPTLQQSLPPPPRQDYFEPQVYEPVTQQKYEPLQQEQAEEPEPVEESRVDPPVPPTPPCKCQQQSVVAESRADPVKGQSSAPAEVKSGRPLSPARRNVNSFLPQAYRTR